MGYEKYENCEIEMELERVAFRLHFEEEINLIILYIL